MKKYTLSYPDSIKILQESCKKDEAIRSLMQRSMDYNEETLLHTINKLLFETAEKTGTSLYTLCFNTIPDLEYKDLATTIRLSPVEFDFEHDGGYWKNKYYDLLNKMQIVINEEEESK